MKSFYATMSWFLFMAIVQCCLSFKIKVDVQGRITDELLFQEMLVSHFLHFMSGILVKKKKKTICPFAFAQQFERRLDITS